jgi:peptide/nickel transport system substrate-binding protein
MHHIIVSSLKRRNVSFAAVLLLAAILLQACAGSRTELVETASPARSEGRSGTLRIAVQPIVQTDPAFISSDPEVLVANQVTITWWTSRSKTRSSRLATDWKISEDGLVYRIELAEGVLFHDGSLLTEEDVVWTFDRLRNPQSDLPTKDLYSNIKSVRRQETWR